MSNLDQVLNFGPLSRLRRNHALEHATLNLLMRQNPKLRLAGYTDLRGFWIVGDISTEGLQKAADEGLVRLNRGEAALAIHQNCGTNFAATGFLAGTAGWIGMLGVGEGFKKKINRLPIVVTLVTLTLIISQPIGPLIQTRVTTTPVMGDLKIMEITRFYRRGLPMHRIITKG